MTERELQRYADAIGVEYGTLRDYERVAKRFVERSTNLTWSHHQVVAAGRKDAEAILADAERERGVVGDG